MNCKSTYSGQKHSKWAIIFALFVSLFTFSNSVSNSFIFQSNPVFQTEWVDQKRKNSFAPAVFQKALKRIAACIKGYFAQILTFNRLLVVKLMQLTRIVLSIPGISSFFVQEAALNYPLEIDPAKN